MAVRSRGEPAPRHPRSMLRSPRTQALGLRSPAWRRLCRGDDHPRRSRVGVASFCAAAIAASALSGCISARVGQTHDEQRHANRGSASSGGPSVPAVASVGCDAQFVAAMITHHQQALQMSDLAPDRASDQRVIDLAAAIIRKQRIEIAAMTDWLRARDVPRESGDNAGQERHHHAADTPGMLTPAQLDALSSANGAAFDEMFLWAMIRHHRGALTMAEQVLHANDSPVVRTLAVDTAVTQRYENVAMRRLQIELRTGRRPSPAEVSRMIATERFDEPLPTQKPLCQGT
jgi:uncharacterized protein (DUF305 family)